MHIRHLATIVLLWLCAAQLPAQILPPDFLCVTNDTLIWATPNNTCGSFNAYVVYASQNEAGPYAILTTITNPATTRFFHAGANGNTWYYYLQSDYNCPGQMPLSSDTLDNRIPETGPVRRVTVNGTDVIIDWNPSPSPEVFGYVISRNTTSGTTIIDTVFGSVYTYTDSNAEPDMQAETYFVTALDRCGNKSLVAAPHNTLFLETGNPDLCKQSIALNWNAYNNWSGGVRTYEIWIGVNGAAATRFDSVAGNTLTYVFDQINDGFTYCFTIVAVEQGSGEKSASNVICKQLTVTQPLRQLDLLNATVGAAGAVDLQWLWGPDNAELSDANVERSANGSNFSNATALAVPFAAPLTPDNNLTDANAGADVARRLYRVATEDVCGVEFLSNEVATIFLKGEAMEAGGANSLIWSPYQNGLADTITYQLFRTPVGGSSPQLIATLGGNEIQYIDDIDLSKPDLMQACYYVEATAQLVLPDGSMRTVVSRSNVICLEQPARIYIPNVFAPNGINSVFQPIMPFGEPMSYHLIIYDRWGGQVFESESISTGWNGKKNGKAMPQGVYLYYIRLEQSGGRVIEKTGDVMLMR